MDSDNFLQKIKQLFFLKLKFAGSSLVATVVDYGLYLTLVDNVYNPAVSNLISMGAGMLVNFALLKRPVFTIQRKVSHAFLMSLTVSLLGILLGTAIIHYLSKIEFFATHQYLTKLLVIATIFFYNFYLKRFSFEKKFL